MAITPLDYNKSLRQDIVVKQGDTWRKRFALQTDETGDPENGTAVNISGATWALKVSDKVSGTEKMSRTTDTDWSKTGVHVDTAADGEFSVNVVSGDTATICDWIWELVMTISTSLVETVTRTLMFGRFVVQEDAVA